MPRIAYAMVMVSDMDRSVEFYRDRMGLSLRFASAGWTEFETEGTTLALHRADSPAAAGHAGGAAGTCRLAFHVEDLEAFHTAAVAAGVPCLSPPIEQFGIRTALFADPDGLEITVGQHPGG